MRRLAAIVLVLCPACGSGPDDTATGGPASEAAAQDQKPQANVMLVPWGLKFSCYFKSHGRIEIDTDTRDPRIVINGQSLPAELSGQSYRSIEGSEVVAFGPEQTYWEYKGERSQYCRVS